MVGWPSTYDHFHAENDAEIWWATGFLMFFGEFEADFQIQIGGSHGIRVSHPVGGLVVVG